MDLALWIAIIQKCAMKGSSIGYITRSYIYNIKLPKICTMF